MTHVFDKILVATDLSAASDQVITCLPGLKRLGTEQVVHCHALGIRHLDVMRYELARLVEPRLAAAVVGVLVEVPVMLSVCKVCNRTRHWFPASEHEAVGLSGVAQ
jgi:hypothetical protein